MREDAADSLPWLRISSERLSGQHLSASTQLASNAAGFRIVQKAMHVAAQPDLVKKSLQYCCDSIGKFLVHIRTLWQGIITSCYEQMRLHLRGAHTAGSQGTRYRLEGQLPALSACRSCWPRSLLHWQPQASPETLHARFPGPCEQAHADLKGQPAMQAGRSGTGM